MKKRNLSKKNLNESRIDNLFQQTNFNNAILSMDEVEECFPKPEVIREIKQEKEKDYTVIKHENGKLQELVRYKFQYDLLIWQVFYEKCHEIENVFFIKDDILDKAGNNIEDITVRELKYKRQNKTYADLLENDYYQKKYADYEKSMNIGNEEIEEEVTMTRYSFAIISFILILLSFGNIFIDYTKFCPYKYSRFIVTAFLDFIAIIFIFFFMLIKKKIKIKKYQAKVRPHMSYEEWLEKQKASEETQSKIALMKKKYIDVIKVEEERIIKYASVMKNIKERMMEIIPLYKDFYSEDKVNYLLNTVIDRKCDTIRKSVKLAKEKYYQVDYLSSAERLVKNFKFLENYSSYIEEYNHLEMNKRIEFDEAIEKNNQILEYLLRIQINKIIVENDPFIN